MKNIVMENRDLKLRIESLERVLKLLLEQHHMDLDKFIYEEAFRLLNKELE